MIATSEPDASAKVHSPFKYAHKAPSKSNPTQTLTHNPRSESKTPEATGAMSSSLRATAS